MYIILQNSLEKEVFNAVFLSILPPLEPLKDGSYGEGHNNTREEMQTGQTTHDNKIYLQKEVSENISLRVNFFVLATSFN